jgi:hypothetical protein
MYGGMAWKVSEFRAKSADGTEHVIEVWHIPITDQGYGGVPSRIDIRQTMHTWQGQHVSYVSRCNYRLTATGEALTSDDPAAP